MCNLITDPKKKQVLKYDGGEQGESGSCSKKDHNYMQIALMSFDRQYVLKQY